jgi:ABC-type glutathione transport system ATPase component
MRPEPSDAYPLLSVRNLSKHYPLRTWWGGKGSVFRAVEDVSFDIRPGPLGWWANPARASPPSAAPSPC